MIFTLASALYNKQQKNNMTIFSNNYNASFGWHANGSLSEDLIQRKKIVIATISTFDTVQKVTLVALAILHVTVAVSLLPAALPLCVAYSIFLITFTTSNGLRLYSHALTCQTAGIVFNPTPEDENLHPPLGSCEGIPTQNCADTVEWRKKLIAAAEHNIVISGNYCGGDSFVDLLELIKQKIADKPLIKVVIISSPNFLTGNSKAALDQMTKDFPHNFSLVLSPDIWHISPGIKKSTNHTKGFVIDYGKYFILGGSGIKDNFAKTGLDHLTNERFLQQENHSLSSSTLNTSESTEDTNPTDDGMLRHIIPGNFRDMDFVFHSPTESSGQEMYKQMLLLALRWEEYELIRQGKEISFTERNPLNIYTGAAASVNPEESITVQLLKTPIPTWESVKTHVKAFHEDIKKASDIAMQIFSSGPEQQESSFAKELLNRIRSAENRIIINHMYFHPTAEILQALAEAAERGVQIKIITVGTYKNCPVSHHVFAPRNRYNYAQLAKLISENAQRRLEVFEFQQRKKGLHKKAIVIDDTVIAGSSNLGYKSLVTTSDYEINFFATNNKFAEETISVCNEDIRYSKKIQSPASIRIGTCFKAAFHRLIAPLVG